jgi:hypothetical protein
MMSFFSSRRAPSLRRRISSQCHCSRRCIYLLDEHFDFPTDQDIDEFIEHAHSTKFRGAHGIDYDCDDPAREFWCKSKKWFEDKGLNVASAFLLRRSTLLQKAHAFNFFIRKSDYRLIFIDNFERVPIAGRAFLVVM